MDGQKISVTLGVISLIFFIVKLLRIDRQSRAVLIPSMKKVKKKEKPVHTTTPTAWSSVSILFRSTTAIPMRSTMSMRVRIMMTMMQTGLMITTR